jgi:hypothetical protein
MIGKGRCLTPQPVQGYGQVALRGTGHPHAGGLRAMKLVHVLVLEAFCGPCPEGMEAAHWNGVRSDCRLWNLRWATRAENQADKVRHGKTKLTPEKVMEIRESLALGFPQRIIAKDFGISGCAVSHIHTRKVWGHIPGSSERTSQPLPETEMWRPCVGFLRYEVSSCGGVRRIGSRGNQPLVFKRSDGKLAVRLTAASRTYIRSIDRLVEEAFTR